MDIIKNNHNYTVQISFFFFFFKKTLKLYMVLVYTFFFFLKKYTIFKPYISKICNGFTLYIYDLNFN